LAIGRAIREKKTYDTGRELAAAFRLALFDKGSWGSHGFKRSNGPQIWALGRRKSPGSIPIDKCLIHFWARGDEITEKEKKGTRKKTWPGMRCVAFKALPGLM